MIIQNKKQFTPIKITLECEFEARILKDMCGKVSGNSLGDVRKVTDTLYNSIRDYLETEEPSLFNDGSILDPVGKENGGESNV